MRSAGHTSMGGKGGRFQPTHWTAIQAIKAGASAPAQVLLGELLQSYWKPVYCYLRRRGYDNERAKDLTQGFFQEIVLGRELIQSADPKKGRFRTLLLTALQHYLTSEHRRRTARKRQPAEAVAGPGWADVAELPAVVRDLSCEESFHYAWVTELLDKLLTEVKDECADHGMELHWQLFQERVLRPLLEDRPAPSLAELCSAHGIEEATRASNMIFAVKRRLQAALTRHLRRCVAGETEVSEEAEELARFLGRRRQKRQCDR